jgi:hypothetical protein
MGKIGTTVQRRETTAKSTATNTAETSKKTMKKLNARSIGVCPRLVNPIQDIEHSKKA